MLDRVLVVCVGNICRSPVGERVLSAGLPSLRIVSAGLHAVVGHGADATAAEAAAAQGIGLDGHVAQMLTAELGMAKDLILVMEKSHRNEVAQRLPQLLGRTMLFAHWIDGGIDIADPYRQPRAVHDRTVSLIRRAGAEWIDRLKPKGA